MDRVRDGRDLMENGELLPNSLSIRMLEAIEAKRVRDGVPSRESWFVPGIHDDPTYQRVEAELLAVAKAMFAPAHPNYRYQQRTGREPKIAARKHALGYWCEEGEHAGCDFGPCDCDCHSVQRTGEEGV